VITPVYAQTMARYNIWQNKQLLDVINVMPQSELDKDRRAFFGSISGTLSHLLWGDLIQLSRFDAKYAAPAVPELAGKGHWPSNPSWVEQRAACDDQITTWAAGLRQQDIDGTLTWYSSSAKQEFTKPMALCIPHFFNHQTHHRGQVHAMLTAAGHVAPVSDLPFMPEE
jgi:uncharacterized damage-inducible protein DinB